MKRALVWAWAALLCAVLFAQTYLRASRPDGIDFTSYLLSARAVLHGNSPYLLATPFPYLYPATLAFLLIPFTFIPPIVALGLWFALNVAAGAWSIRRVLLAARPELERRPDDVALFLAVFFTFFFTIVQSNLRNGQVNFLVLFFCVAGQLFFNGAGAPPPARADADASPRIHFSSAQHGRRRLLSAFSWALAVSIKIVPLALLPFFALRRHWTWLVASVLMIGVFCLLPVVVLGTRVIDLYEQYWRVFLASSFAPRAQPLDFSLGGTIAFITRAPLTPLLRLSAAAIVLGWIIPVDGRRLHVEVLRPFGLYLLAIPLVSPQSEVHHLAFMLPAAAIVAASWGSDASRITAAVAGALYLTATAVTRLNGPLYCAALIALGVALMNVGPPDVVRLKPDATEDKAAYDESSGGVRLSCHAGAAWRRRRKPDHTAMTLSIIQRAAHRRVLQLGLPPGARILDAPCGAGALTAALRDEGYAAHGADIEPAARAKLGEAFSLADLSHLLPWPDGSFNAVVSTEGIEHLENRQAFLRELFRILKSGGTLVITTPNTVSLRSRARFYGSGFFHQDPRPLREAAPHPLHHIGLMTFPELRYALHTAGFRIVEVSHTHIKPISYLYAVLAPYAWLYTTTAFRKERDPAQRIANGEIRRVLFSSSVLFGENVLVVARRPGSGPEPVVPRLGSGRP